MGEPARLSRAGAVTLLVLTILLWGFNWPIIKIGLEHIAPFWFSFIRIGSASVILFLVLSLMGRNTVPARRDWPVIFSVGLLQVGIAMGLIHLAILYVEPGRSAVLIYSMPIWIAPLAYLFLGEKLNILKLTGLALGVVGIAILFNPLAFPWGNGEYLFGNGLLLISSLMWAISIVHVRGHDWSGSTLSILPWQLLIGALVLLPLAITFEGFLSIDMTWELAAILIYNGPIVSAFGFFAYISASRALPANTTGMASLAIPVVGILSSAVMTGEVLTVAVLAGMGLIGCGVLMAGRSGE